MRQLIYKIHEAECVFVQFTKLFLALHGIRKIITLSTRTDEFSSLFLQESCSERWILSSVCIIYIHV
jgi:hypothetical protein